MAKAYVFLADGFEDIEALAPIDIMRRGGVEVVTVGIMGTNEVISAHGVTVLADVPFEFAGDFEDADLTRRSPSTENAPCFVSACQESPCMNLHLFSFHSIYFRGEG